MSIRRNKPPDGDSPPPDPESTVELLERIKSHDEVAGEKLFLRYQPRLVSYVRRHFPPEKRNLNETGELVHSGWMNALERLRKGGFEYRNPGSFFLYVRTILKNLIRDENRKRMVRPHMDVLPADLADQRESPLQRAIGNELLARYEAALDKLEPRHRAAVVMGLEMGFTHREIAEAMGDNHPNAARMRLVRAILKLQALLKPEIEHED